MRLKTKFQDEDFDLGEVVEANIYHGGNGRVKVIAEPTKGGIITFYFETLKGMNEMFEDYEEPKNPCFINWFGEVSELLGHISNKEIEKLKEAGNYFSSGEEAELAVRKLKALKRLKDKGFRFELWDYDGGNYQERIKTGRILFRVKDYEEVDELLDLLFGGEE